MSIGQEEHMMLGLIHIRVILLIQLNMKWIRIVPNQSLEISLSHRDPLIIVSVMLVRVLIQLQHLYIQKIRYLINLLPQNGIKVLIIWKIKITWMLMDITITLQLKDLKK